MLTRDKNWLKPSTQLKALYLSLLGKLQSSEWKHVSCEPFLAKRIEAAEAAVSFERD